MIQMDRLPVTFLAHSLLCLVTRAVTIVIVITIKVMTAKMIATMTNMIAKMITTKMIATTTESDQFKS